MSTDACLWRGCGGFVLNVFMHSSYSKRLVSNFIALGIVQGTNFLLPIIVIPFVISRIGTDGFGAVSVVQVIMMFFTNVSDYGFNLTATRDVSINREKNDLLSKNFLYSSLHEAGDLLFAFRGSSLIRSCNSDCTNPFRIVPALVCVCHWPKSSYQLAVSGG